MLAIFPPFAGASTGPPKFAQETERNGLSPDVAHAALGGDDVEYVTNAQHQRIGRRGHIQPDNDCASLVDANLEPPREFR
ncbi:MAG: hypothetical protein R3F60_18745 [bacterium]